METELPSCSAEDGTQLSSSSGRGRKSYPFTEWPHVPSKRPSCIPAHVSLPSHQWALHQLREGQHSCQEMTRWVQVPHESFLQQLQTHAAAEIPSQLPILTCSLLPQKHPQSSRMGALGQVLLCRSYWHCWVGSRRRTEHLGWEREGSLVLAAAPIQCVHHSRAVGVLRILLW